MSCSGRATLQILIKPGGKKTHTCLHRHAHAPTHTRTHALDQLTPARQRCRNTMSASGEWGSRSHQTHTNTLVSCQENEAEGAGLRVGGAEGDRGRGLALQTPPPPPASGSKGHLSQRLTFPDSICLLCGRIARQRPRQCARASAPVQLSVSVVHSGQIWMIYYGEC